MKKRKKQILLGAVLFLAGWTLWGNTALETNGYLIRSQRLPAEFDGFRIVQISDFHNAGFGDKVISQVKAAHPDIIVITGDLIDSRRTDVEVALELVRQAVEIAPVYYVSGNHESRVEEYEELKQGLDDLGVTRLEFQKTTLWRDGASITLMGLNDPAFLLDPDPFLEAMTPPDDGYSILLSHRPERFETYVDAGVDLVFTGHAHGGQVRLPLVGGLVAPNQGYFPKYDAGAFTEGNTTMLVSRGVGNSLCPLRFNNRPEIVVATLRSI